MTDSYPKFKAAVAQLAPSFLNREETVEVACNAIEEAGKEGARIIAFPESFIPGYPYWLWIEPALEAVKHFREFFKKENLLAYSVKLACQDGQLDQGLFHFFLRIARQPVTGVIKGLYTLLTVPTCSVI